MALYKELVKECVGAHEFCWMRVGECPYCEPKVPLRDEKGRFAKIDGEINDEK